MDWNIPSLPRGATAVWRRNVLVWRKLIVPSLLINFGEPLLYLMGLGFGLGAFIGEMAGLPYLTFLASGIAASSAMNTASFEGMYSVYTRMVPQRTYDSILATPLGVDDIVAGEMLWCATKSTISGIAILAVAFAFGAVQGTSALLVVPVFFLTGFAFAGPALVMAALSQGYDFFSYYFTLFITPMFMLCGVFFPVSGLPDALQPAIQALPLTHAVELIRPLMAGQATSGSAGHLLYLALFALLGYYLAAIFIRRRMIV